MSTSILHTSFKFAKERFEVELPTEIVKINLLQVSYLPAKGENHFTLIAEVNNRLYAGYGRSVGLAADNIVEKVCGDRGKSYDHVELEISPSYGKH